MTNAISTKQRNFLDYATRFNIGKALEAAIEKQGDICFYKDGWSDERIASGFQNVSLAQVANTRKSIFPNFVRRASSRRRGPGKTTVKLLNVVKVLENALALQNQTIEAHQQLINHLREQNSELNSRLTVLEMRRVAA